VTGDEGDPRPQFRQRFSRRSQRLLPTSSSRASIRPARILQHFAHDRDIYGLTNSAAVPPRADLDTNLQGKLGVPQSAGASTVGQSGHVHRDGAPAGPAPERRTGAVQFVVDGSNFGSPFRSSTARPQVPAFSFLTHAGHSAFAVYSGSASFSANTSSLLSQSVSAAATSVSLSSYRA